MRDLHLRGIPEISKVYVQENKSRSYDANTGAVVDKQMEWEILTDGTKLKEIFLLDKIDFRRVISNDINQIYEVLGIEATRLTLINELNKVLRHYGIYVNYRHLAILCDVMTQQGYLTSITRHGINRVEQGPLRKCSFEETVEILLEAGLFSEIDNLRGISENIMLGQLGPFGTGSFDLLFDSDKVKNSDILEDNRLLEDNMENYENNDNDLATPNHYANDGSYSPTARTPFGLKTPNIGYNNSFTPMTTHRQSPMFTPNKSSMKTPLYSLNTNNMQDNEPVVNITSPYPYAKNYSMSPNYSTNEHAYSPIYDSDINVDNTKYNSFYGNETYSPRESMPTKSPCINQAYRYNNNISSPIPYSPSSPMIKTTKGMSSNYAYSPSYNLHNTSSANMTYSPTTPLNHHATSPEYSKGNFYSVRSSSYSAINSPKLNYSPNSPTYNPKSPAYNISSSSKFFYLKFLLFIHYMKFIYRLYGE
jgi:DNA-directed RNA polymerase II subunit RPB1